MNPELLKMLLERYGLKWEDLDITQRRALEQTHAASLPEQLDTIRPTLTADTQNHLMQIREKVSAGKILSAADMQFLVKTPAVFQNLAAAFGKILENMGIHAHAPHQDEGHKHTFSPFNKGISTTPRPE